LNQPGFGCFSRALGDGDGPNQKTLQTHAIGGAIE